MDDDFLNYDPRAEMDEFVQANNWVQSANVVSPAPLTGSCESPFDLSAVNTDDYDVSDMQPTPSRGKGKKAATESTGPRKYALAETLVLAKIWIDVSEDPIIGNQQKFRTFWERVTEKYNAERPKGSPEREYEMLRKHWSRVQKDVLKWAGMYANMQRMWPSGHSLTDIVNRTNESFHRDEGKHFKFYEVWQLIHKSPKFGGGAECGGGETPKRTKVSASGNYSSSGGTPSIDLNLTEEDPDLSDRSMHSRPMGTKAAKRRASASKGKGKVEQPEFCMPPPPPNPSLDKMSESMNTMSMAFTLPHYRELLMTDTSSMSDAQLAAHNEALAAVRKVMSKQ